MLFFLQLILTVQVSHGELVLGYGNTRKFTNFPSLPATCEIAQIKQFGHEISGHISQSGHILQTWNIASESIAPSIIASHGKHMKVCIWLIYDNINPAQYNQVHLTWAVKYGYNVVFMERRLSTNKLPSLIHKAKHSLILVANEGWTGYTMNAARTNFQPLSSPLFVQNTNFAGKKLVFAEPKNSKDKGVKAYKDKRGNLSYPQSVWTQVAIALNGSMGYVKYNSSLASRGELKYHLTPPYPMIKERAANGIPVFFGKWDGVGFLVRTPHVSNSTSRHLSVKEILGHPLFLVLYAASSVAMALVAMYAGSERNIVIFLEMIWHFLEICQNQPLQDSTLRHITRYAPVSLAITPFLAGAILFTSMLQTDYTSHLTAADIHYPPRIFKELIASDYMVSTFGFEDHPVTKEVLHQLEENGNQFAIALKRKIVRRYQRMNDTLCMMDVLNLEKVACAGNFGIGRTAGVKIVWKRELGKKFFDGSLHLLSSYFFAVMVNPKFIHIEATVYQVFTILTESGLRPWLEKQQNEKRILRGILRSRKRNATYFFSKEVVEDAGIGMKNNLPMLLWAGLVSLSVFVIELLVYHMST